ncbi:MAG TPA: dephospho-CoA kinase [Methylotenera sp.]|nr:dephospho-CoA kinase [Methylotenera sp.]
MFIIALTGGIGSGKSEAAKQFSLLGVPVVDTDAIAHALTVTGAPLLKIINQKLGGNFLAADGSLNRAKLRSHIFDNKEDRLNLEAILHPAIHALALEKLVQNEMQLRPNYQILVVPLLFENNRYDALVNRILVIDCDESVQIERAMARSNLTESQVKAMMAAQVSRKTRLTGADEVIENNGQLEELVVKVANLHKKFIKTCVVNK